MWNIGGTRDTEEMRGEERGLWVLHEGGEGVEIKVAKRKEI